MENTQYSILGKYTPDIQDQFYLVITFKILLSQSGKLFTQLVMSEMGQEYSVRV